jgi:hypothetical protein
MKKSIMMAAVAALLAGPAMSDISIYGQVEQSISTSADAKNISDDNYVGVSVSEAFGESGNGAFAKIEFGVDDETNAVTNRETYVGVNLGDITAQVGRQKNLRKTMVNGVDAFQGTSFSVAGAARADDTVVVKGELGGITLAGSTQLDGTANADEVGETRELGAAIEVQGISLAAVQSKAGSADAVLTLAAGAEIAGVNLAVAHQPDAANVTTTVAGSMDLGNNTVRGGYEFVDGSDNTMIAEVAHNFSSNTSAFVNYSKAENADAETMIGMAINF